MIVKIVMKSYWSEREDQMLCDKINEYDGNWNEIIKFFPDRTLPAIKIRWSRIDPSFASGKWESEEDSQLIDWVINQASMSVDSFQIDSKPRRRNDIIKRIEYYKQVLDTKFCSELYKKSRNGSIKPKKRQVKQERKVIMKHDMMDTKAYLEQAKNEIQDQNLNQLFFRDEKSLLRIQSKI